jgi:predicted nucleic acid-binding protein
MLFIYLLEDHPIFGPRAWQLIDRSFNRGDALFTSHLAIGEVLAGAEKAPNPQKTYAVRELVREMGFTCLPFDEGAMATFSRLRSIERLKIADSIHLASAASAGMDLFLTGDRKLTRLDIPGIQFIADFNGSIL